MSVKSKKVTESVFGSSYAEDSILWPEWSDTALNKENWANPKNGTDGLFMDTQLVGLPPSLQPSEWIRAKNLRSLTEQVTVFVATSEYPDLITNNQHILHSEFARWVISALINLQYCGRDGLEISGENSNFIWNGRHQSWCGWMHVYSLNKAGKGVQHRPIVNPNGKYVVRLYFLGSWRYIVVDDTIPVNPNGLPLLPRTANGHELWPMLLSKALLKLCSVTWFRNREIVDFHPVSCLTGWVCLRLEIGYLSPQDKWDLLRKYTDHFEWEAKTMKHETLESKKDNDELKSKETSPSKKSKGTEGSKTSKDTVESKKSKDTERSKKSKGDQRKKPVILKKPEPVTLFLGLEDMKTLSSETVPGLSPCENHLIFIAQIRDIPLDPEDVKPPLARWKHFRWVKWASEKGMINPADYFAPIRFLKIVSPLKSFGETIINKHTDEIVEKADEKDVSDPKSTPKRTEKTKSRDRSKESKSQTPKPSVKKTPEKAPPFDITFWADFNKMGPYVKDVHFFYKLDYFQYTARVSDRFTVKDSHDKKIDSKKSSKKGSREHSPVRITSREAKFIDIHCWPQKMLKSRNEPLYLFVDSLEEKFFLINFSTFQVSADPQASSSVSEEDANKSTDDLANQSNDLQTVSRFTRLVAIKDYLIIERHSWFHRQKYGNDLVHLLTTGTRSTVLELESGRHLLRMYCGSEANCFVTISSDTIFHLGDRRKMYELMCTESDAIDLKVRHISNCASNAYQSFGTDKYPEALKLYYNSYLPPAYNSRAKIFYSYIHACFLNEKVRLIQGLVPADQMQGILRSLRIFFLNPMIGLEYFNPFTRALKAIRNSNTPRTSIERQKLIDQSPTEANVLNKDYAASVIQSLFKTLLIIRYKMIHNPKHREHRAVLENLLKVVELFNYNKRESLATHLFRYILKHFDRLRDIYPCSKDFEHTIQVQKLTGTLGVVKPGQWVPIARFLVNTKTMETAFANIDLFINLPRYCVRVFNNETKQEMLRVVNNVVPTRYEHTKSGYTVFAYGWSDDQLIKEVTWTMFMITKKGQPVFYSMDETISQSTTLATPFLVTEELSNAYIPNSRKYISKWIAKISKPTLVSFRLSTSYDKVKIKFRVTDTEGTVLLEMTGGSVVIVPLVFLGLEAESSEIQLMIDAKSEGGRPIRNDTNGKAMNEAGNDTVEDSTVKTDVNGSKASEETLCHRTYHVEAFVLDDSWPLTKSEWIAVTEVKMRPVGSAVRPKSSTLTIGKFSKAEVSKIKRAAKALTDSNQVLEKPYCVLQVVTDVGSGFEIAEDKLSEQQIAKMKETWAKNDPESLSRGKLLQENFRQKYEFTPKPSETDTKSEASVPGRKSSVKLECCVETPAISEIRTLEPPLLFRRLPTLDLTIYENREDEEDTPWVKTPYDEEILRCRRAVNIIYAQEDYDYFIEEMNGLMKNRRERYRMLLKEHEELFRERKAMVEEVYEARKAYIAGTNPGSVRGSKKSAKTKSSKSKKV